MWTYIVGPFLVILPKRWREALSPAGLVNWARAAVLSGFAEFVLALMATLNWYSISMTTWVNRGLEVALSGNAPGVTDHAIGAMAWFMWANHPLTWLLGYLSVEGAVRLCAAAFSDAPLGIFPLFIIDKSLRVFFGGSETAQAVPGAASSFLGAVSEKILESSVPVTADEIAFRKSGTDEIMEIRASRKKQDWEPPRVVRVRDDYYRLEDFSKCAGARPFRYTLRKLSAGVPGRTVIVYQPEEAVAGKR